MSYQESDIRRFKALPTYDEYRQPSIQKLLNEFCLVCLDLSITSKTF
jgi:hypothetical protein